MLTDPQLSEAIKGYEVALLPLALRLVGRDGADLDDLLQEGRISVWQQLVRGYDPNMVLAYRRMRDWTRHLRTHYPADYSDMEEWEDG